MLAITAAGKPDVETNTTSGLWYVLSAAVGALLSKAFSYLRWHESQLWQKIGALETKIDTLEGNQAKLLKSLDTTTAERDAALLRVELLTTENASLHARMTSAGPSMQMDQQPLQVHT